VQIDWFTLIAQIVNFLILLGLLKYFLYDRITAAMDQRKQDISDRITEAQETKSSAEEELEKYRRKKQEIEERQQEILNSAKEEAENKKKEMVREARSELEQRRRRWREALRKEQDDFVSDLQEQIGKQTYTVVRRAMADLADMEIEKAMVESFINRLDNLEDEELSRISESAEKADGGVVVTTSFPPGDETISRINKSLKELLDENIDISYRQSDDILAGIQVDVGGRRLAWNIKHYLDNLEDYFLRIISQRTEKENRENKDDKSTPEGHESDSKREDQD